MKHFLVVVALLFLVLPACNAVESPTMVSEPEVEFAFAYLLVDAVYRHEGTGGNDTAPSSIDCWYDDGCSVSVNVYERLNYLERLDRFLLNHPVSGSGIFRGINDLSRRLRSPGTYGFVVHDDWVFCHDEGGCTQIDQFECFPLTVTLEGVPATSEGIEDRVRLGTVHFSSGECFQDQTYGWTRFISVSASGEVQKIFP